MKIDAVNKTVDFIFAVTQNETCKQVSLERAWWRVDHEVSRGFGEFPFVGENDEVLSEAIDEIIEKSRRKP